MGKPNFDIYQAFRKKFFEITKEYGKEQYLVPYLMSSHPGSTLNDALELALYLKKEGYTPEQVQDFYPTPGTASTVMYYTGINPLTGKNIYVPRDYHEKQLQRALLQYNRPANATFVREAIKLCGRDDLIGYGKDALIKPENPQKNRAQFSPQKREKSSSNAENNKKSYNKYKKPPNKAKKSKNTKIDRMTKNK